MSIAERIRLDELCQQVSDLTARVRALEGRAVGAFTVEGMEAAAALTPRLVDDDPEPAKRRPGRPRKSDPSDS